MTAIILIAIAVFGTHLVMKRARARRARNSGGGFVAFVPHDLPQKHRRVVS